MQVLYVKWVDSCREGFSWTDPEDIELELTTIETVGFLYKETATSIALIQNKEIGDEPDEILFIINIPKVAILEKETIYTPSIG